ncbi:MAG TPA: TolC family protein, partial [Candidatus Hydrogenedentes bacterium]|nr:TolC family protein [Candidatus Hydrogenedentota bacterium]
MTSFLLASCATFAPPERGTQDLPLPESFTLYGPAVSFPERWWEGFGSEELCGLVQQALDGNFTLQQAVARLRQAAAVAKRAGAVRRPELDFNAEASVTRTHRDAGESPPLMDTAAQKLNALNTLLGGAGPGANAGGNAAASTSALGAAASAVQSVQTRVQGLDALLSAPPASETTFTAESYLLGLTTSYELDLWGRLSAAHRSARLDLEATREDLYTAMQTIAGQVVLTWLDTLVEKQGLGVVRDQLATNKTNLELIELRYRKGMATALDVFQQRQAVAQAAAAIPPLEARLETLTHELAVLLGKPPRADLGLADGAFPEAGPLPAQGIPADLLARRPDVRAAGLDQYFKREQDGTTELIGDPPSGWRLVNQGKD